MAKNPDGTLNLDPYVEQAIAGGRRREAQRSMSPSQRKRAKYDQARNRRMIDIEPELEQYLVDIAAQLSVPVSQLIGFVLRRGLYHVDLDELKACRLVTKSLRYEYDLIYPERNQ